MVAIVGGGAVAAPASPTAAAATDRFSGSTRYDTAAAVSEAVFDPGVDVAFLATGENFPDALAGGAAAAQLGGPVLLVQRDAIPAATAKELQRLEPARVVIVGGRSVVSDGVATRAADLVEGDVERISGATRWDTAALVAAAAFATADTAYVANGFDFAGALSAGGAAPEDDAPILLVEPGGVPAATAEQLQRLDPERVILLGGSGAIPPTVQDRIDQLVVGEVTRIAGKDRYETSALANRAAFPNITNKLLLATGESFPDALAGTAAAGALGAPLLMVRHHCVTPAGLEAVAQFKPSTSILLGGEAALRGAVETLEDCTTRSALENATLAPGTCSWLRAAGLEFPDPPTLLDGELEIPGGGRIFYAPDEDEFPLSLRADYDADGHTDAAIAIRCTAGASGHAWEVQAQSANGGSLGAFAVGEGVEPRHRFGLRMLELDGSAIIATYDAGEADECMACGTRKIVDRYRFSSGSVVREDREVTSAATEAQRLLELVNASDPGARDLATDAVIDYLEDLRETTGSLAGCESSHATEHESWRICHMTNTHFLVMETTDWGVWKAVDAGQG